MSTNGQPLRNFTSAATATWHPEDQTVRYKEYKTYEKSLPSLASVLQYALSLRELVRVTHDGRLRYDI
jgi:hypothetical protein